MFEIRVTTHFSSAHRLVGYEGDCCRDHGHNWIVDAVVACEELDDIGIGVDFRDVRGALERAVSPLDHRNLNDVPPFDERNPTSENVARYLYQRLGEELASFRDRGVRVARVTVSETPGAGASYYESERRP